MVGRWGWGIQLMKMSEQEREAGSKWVLTVVDLVIQLCSPSPKDLYSFFCFMGHSEAGFGDKMAAAVPDFRSLHCTNQETFSSQNYFSEVWVVSFSWSPQQGSPSISPNRDTRPWLSHFLWLKKWPCTNWLRLEERIFFIHLGPHLDMRMGTQLGTAERSAMLKGSGWAALCRCWPVWRVPEEKKKRVWVELWGNRFWKRWKTGKSWETNQRGGGEGGQIFWGGSPGT